MDATTALLAVLRGVHLLALLLLLGTLVTLVAIALPAAACEGSPLALARRHLLTLARWAAAAALLSGCAWLIMQATVIGAADNVPQALSVFWVVVHTTRFGHVMVIRLALIGLALPLLRRPRWCQAVGLGLVVLSAALQGLLGHAGAFRGTEGHALIASEALHLAAAGSWLGALPPLVLLIATLPPPEAAAMCRRFSPIGLAAVLVLTGTALAQATVLIGNVPALVGTSYGNIALIKLGLFLLLLGLALTNRFALTTRLDRNESTARRWMLRSVIAETGVGMGAVLAASFLAASVPALHEQPTWPFAWRPSLAAMADPDLRREVVNALIAIGAAVVVAILGLVWRKLRWPALAIAAVMLWFALPHLDLLWVTAYPTSYYTSPTDFAADSIARGATLFPANCAACHGAAGHGDGPRAAQLPERPADLTAPHLWAHADGELFWWLTDGIEAPEGGTAMPGFGKTLSADDRWALIDYIRAHNAGTAMVAADAWPVPVRAPEVPIDCNGVAGDDSTELTGSVLRVIADSSPSDPTTVPIPPQHGVRTITLRLSPDGTVRPGPGECVAATPEAWPAFAILAGLDPNVLGGTEFLVDPRGWLRALWRPGEPGIARTQDQLITAIRQIITHPVTAQEAGAHAHHH
jgi:putative copper export protein/mono/diheme cytochrome c family protein